MSRPLNEIAQEINRTWTNPYFGAKPYIEAMSYLKTVHDFFIEDSAFSIVAYFLANAQTWKGENARRIKAELKKMIS